MAVFVGITKALGVDGTMGKQYDSKRQPKTKEKDKAIKEARKAKHKGQGR